MEKTIISFDPSNGERLGEVPTTSREQISKIVAQSHAAAKSWQRIEIAERVALLETAYGKMEPQLDQLATLLRTVLVSTVRQQDIGSSPRCGW